MSRQHFYSIRRWCFADDVLSQYPSASLHKGHVIQQLGELSVSLVQSRLMPRKVVSGILSNSLHPEKQLQGHWQNVGPTAALFSKSTAKAGVPLGVCALAPSPLLWPVLLDCEGEFMDSFLLLFGLAQVRRHEA